MLTGFMTPACVVADIFYVVIIFVLLFFLVVDQVYLTIFIFDGPNAYVNIFYLCFPWK